MKAQVSTEYLIMVGFALLLTVPTVIIFFTQSTQNVEQVNSIQARQIARKIVDNAEKIYYLGEPSVTTIKVAMPRGIDSIKISRRELVFNLKDSSGIVNSVVEVSSINLTGNLSPSSGIQTIRIANIGEVVNISYS